MSLGKQSSTIEHIIPALPPNCFFPLHEQTKHKLQIQKNWTQSPRHTTKMAKTLLLVNGGRAKALLKAPFCLNSLVSMTKTWIMCVPWQLCLKTLFFYKNLCHSILKFFFFLLHVWSLIVLMLEWMPFHDFHVSAEQKIGMSFHFMSFIFINTSFY